MPRPGSPFCKAGHPPRQDRLVRPARRGHRVRIHAAYGSPEFVAEYQAAMTEPCRRGRQGKPGQVLWNGS